MSPNAAVYLLGASLFAGIAAIIYQTRDGLPGGQRGLEHATAQDRQDRQDQSYLLASVGNQGTPARGPMSKAWNDSPTVGMFGNPAGTPMAASTVAASTSAAPAEPVMTIEPWLTATPIATPLPASTTAAPRYTIEPWLTGPPIAPEYKAADLGGAIETPVAPCSMPTGFLLAMARAWQDGKTQGIVPRDGIEDLDMGYDGAWYDASGLGCCDTYCRKVVRGGYWSCIDPYTVTTQYKAGKPRGVQCDSGYSQRLPLPPSITGRDQ